MDPESEKRLRLFVNPFAIWTHLAFKTGEAMLATAHVAALRANAPRVAVIPTADAPPSKETRDAPPPKEARDAPPLKEARDAPPLKETRHAPTRVRHASKATRFKASRAKARNADRKRRARPRAAR
jgi:hypothetical protein